MDQQTSPPPLPPRPGLENWALGLGIGGFCCLGPLGFIPAVICGHIVLSRIRRSGGVLKGRALALAGTILGYAGMVILLLVVASHFVLPRVTKANWLDRMLFLPFNHEFVLDMQAESVEGLALPQAAKQVNTVLQARLKGAGVRFKLIEDFSPRQLRVQVRPSSSMPVEQLRDLITQSGFMEFRLVHTHNERLVENLFIQRAAPEGFSIRWIEGRRFFVRDATAAGESPSRETASRIASFRVPSEDYEFMLQPEIKNQQVVYQPVFVSRRPEMAGDMIQESYVSVDPLGTPEIMLGFEGRSAKRFEKLTSDLAPGGARNPDAGRRWQLAIVVDGVVLSSPIVQTPILDGRAVINGQFTHEEARRLAAVLQSGQLPCPVRIVTENPIGRRAAAR